MIEDVMDVMESLEILWELNTPQVAKSHRGKKAQYTYSCTSRRTATTLTTPTTPPLSAAQQQRSLSPSLSLASSKQ